MQKKKDTPSDYSRFQNLSFEDFRKMANTPTLSCYEKIGFPDAFREDKEGHIFQDILRKLPNLTDKNKTIIDIGPGCSTLPHKLINLCKINQHQLILIDSKEMLAQLPDSSFTTKIAAFYPNECKQFIAQHQSKIDVVLVYSVLHYIFTEANLFEFLDDTLSLLADGGQLLLGDIPNVSKRKRFLSSANGVKYHQEHYDPATMPVVNHYNIEKNQLDDSVVLGILMRCRNAGFDAYALPQSPDLPMANRREDILITKP